MVMRRTEWLLTTLVLQTEILERGFSQRFGRWARNRAVGIYETLLRGRQWFGWPAIDTSFVRTARETTLKWVPEYPLIYPAVHQRSCHTTEIPARVWVLDDGTKLSFDSLSWLQDPFGNRSSIARLLFHSLDWVRELIDEYKVTKSEVSLVLAKALTMRWIEECLYTERSKNVWSDHGTALRALILCQLWAVCRTFEPVGSPFIQDLLVTLVRHAEKLSHSKFYRSDHDHGVTQAYALFALGVLLSAHSEAKRWKTLGINRLEAQMAENVSIEGLHREHSLYYHFYIFQHFHYAYRLAQAYEIKFSREFISRLQLMLNTGAYGLKPDSQMPAFGDTSISSPIVTDTWILKEWNINAVQNYLYSSTGGIEGIKPEAASVVCPDGGWVFLRSGWGNDRAFSDECFFPFRLGTFKTAHIHYDVFSFELYAHGADLIVDSGGPFTYGSSERAFLVSTAAHNTVVVDRKNQKVGTADVLHWHTSSEYDLLDAQHRLYPGVVHRRVVIFIKPNYFLIVDRLEAQHPHQYAQLFHLSPVLEVQLDDLSIATVHSTGGPTIQILPLWRQEVMLQMWRGETSLCQGWVCVGERQMVPNSVVEYRQTGTTVTFATLLFPEAPRASTLITGACEGSPLIQETCFHISIGGQCEKIVLLPTGQVILEKG